MIDEGIIIEFMKYIKRQLYEEQARADNADHEEPKTTSGTQATSVL